MKTTLDKHREAGTLDEFRSRQEASRASNAQYHERVASEAEAARNEILDNGTDHERIVALELKVAGLIKLLGSFRP